MKASPPPPLLLFFASRQIGGGEAYFINLGLAAIRAGRRCVVVDYRGGYVGARIPGAELVEYADDAGADYGEECEVFIPVGAVAFLGDKLRLNPASRVLFVSLHHHHAIELGNWAWLLRKIPPRTAGRLWRWLEPCRFRSVRGFFEEMTRRQGLVYCAPFQRDFDEAYLGLTLPAEIVAIPVPRRSSREPGELPVGRSLVWVSRLAEEKAAIIFGLVRELQASRCGLSLIVIGEGPALPAIKAQAARAGVELETPGVISGSELDDYLRRHATLCVGVGTSAIEMAMAGLPTLVASVPGYCDGPFVWFHQTAPGDTIVTPGTVKQAFPLTEALHQLQAPGGWARAAREAQQVATRRHDPEASWGRMSVALAANRLTVAEAVAAARMDEQPFRLIRNVKRWLRRWITRRPR